MIGCSRKAIGCRSRAIGEKGCKITYFSSLYKGKNRQTLVALEEMLVVVFKELYGSSKGEMRLASSSVNVTSTIKHFAGEVINGSVALRTERHLDFIHVLTYENRVFDCTNLERHVDYSFGISRLEIEAPEFV